MLEKKSLPRPPATAAALAALALVLVLTPLAAHAQGAGPLLITTARNRAEKEQRQTELHLVSVEDWTHLVTLQNTSVRPLENLEIRYRVYYMDDHHGAMRNEIKLRFLDGTEIVEKLERGQKHQFETRPVRLEKRELKPGWSYADGSKSAVKDRLRGIWVKVYQEGRLAQEHINPVSLRKSDPWEE